MDSIHPAMKKNTPIQHSLTFGNNKYSYSLEKASKETTRVVCKAAKIDQEFLNEDIPALLSDLPNLIQAEKEHDDQQSEVIRFRINTEEKRLIEMKAVKLGFASVSGYLRHLSLN